MAQGHGQFQIAPDGHLKALWVFPIDGDLDLGPLRQIGRHLALILNPQRLGDPARANRGIYGVGLVSSLRTWLSMWSLEDSQCQAGPHLARLTVPTLLVDATADSGVFPSDSDTIFGAIAASDATRHSVAGDHYFLDPPGARDEVADLIAAWTSDRT